MICTITPFALVLKKRLNGNNMNSSVCFSIQINEVEKKLMGLSRSVNFLERKWKNCTNGIHAFVLLITGMLSRFMIPLSLILDKQQHHCWITFYAMCTVKS